VRARRVQDAGEEGAGLRGSQYIEVADRADGDAGPGVEPGLQPVTVGDEAGEVGEIAGELVAGVAGGGASPVGHEVRGPKQLAALAVPSWGSAIPSATSVLIAP
jgi:hypothetical protein